MITNIYCVVPATAGVERDGLACCANRKNLAVDIQPFCFSDSDFYPWLDYQYLASLDMNRRLSGFISKRSGITRISIQERKNNNKSNLLSSQESET